MNFIDSYQTAIFDLVLGQSSRHPIKTALIVVKNNVTAHKIITILSCTPGFYSSSMHPTVPFRVPYQLLEKIEGHII